MPPTAFLPERDVFPASARRGFPGRTLIAEAHPEGELHPDGRRTTGWERWRPAGLPVEPGLTPPVPRGGQVQRWLKDRGHPVWEGVLA